MSNRSQAKLILEQARDILAARLMQRVIDASEEILEDAHVDSYMGEIDAIFDQIGARLLHVNQLISGLPARDKKTQGNSAEPINRIAPETGRDAQPVTSATSAPFPALALPAPDTQGATLIPSQVVSFQTFLAEIQAGSLEAAGQSLAELLDVDEERGQACARVFHERLTSDPEFPLKAMQLRKELQARSYNGALMLLYECFGLQGVESIGVVQTLLARFATGR